MQLAKATQHTRRHAEWVNEWVYKWVSERKREREWVRVKHALNEISLQLIWQSWCTRRCQNVIPEWQCQVGSQSTPPRQISALYSMCVGVCVRMFRANAKLSEMKLTTFRFCIKAKRSRSRFPTPSPFTPFRLLSSTPFPSLAPLWLFTCSVQWPSLSCCCCCWIYSGSGPMHC